MSEGKTFQPSSDGSDASGRGRHSTLAAEGSLANYRNLQILRHAAIEDKKKKEEAERERRKKRRGKRKPLFKKEREGGGEKERLFAS